MPWHAPRTCQLVSPMPRRPVAGASWVVMWRKASLRCAATPAGWRSAWRVRRRVPAAARGCAPQPVRGGEVAAVQRTGCTRRRRRSGQGGLLGLLGVLGPLGGEVHTAGVRGGARRDGAYSVVGADPAAAARLADRGQAPLASHAQGIGQPLRDGGFACCPGGPERCESGAGGGRYAGANLV